MINRVGDESTWMPRFTGWGAGLFLHRDTREGGNLLAIYSSPNQCQTLQTPCRALCQASEEIPMNSVCVVEDTRGIYLPTTSTCLLIIDACLPCLSPHSQSYGFLLPSRRRNNSCVQHFTTCKMRLRFLICTDMGEGWEAWGAELTLQSHVELEPEREPGSPVYSPVLSQ